MFGFVKNKKVEEKKYPDIIGNRKLICVQGTSEGLLREKINEYFEVCTDSGEGIFSVNIRTLPMEQTWNIVELNEDVNAESDRIFWEYENMLLWLGDLSQKLFLLAIPRSGNKWLISTIDRENSWGDSCRGIYDSNDFYFKVPDESLEWLAVRESGFDHAGFVRDSYGLEIEWLV